MPPAITWKHPEMPCVWTRVLDVMPADMLNPLAPGYVLLDCRKDRPLRAWAAHLEFREAYPLSLASEIPHRRSDEPGRGRH